MTSFARNDKSSARTHNECRAAREASDAQPENSLLRNTPDACSLWPLDRVVHGDWCRGTACAAVEDHAAIVPHDDRTSCEGGRVAVVGPVPCMPASRSVGTVSRPHTVATATVYA